MYAETLTLGHRLVQTVVQMKTRPRVHHILLLSLAILLGSCSTVPEKSVVAPAAEEPIDMQIRPQRSTSRAALSLLEKARAAAREGRLDAAESYLERAIRIEPRNAVLWHYMAKLRLYQGQLDEAAGLAARSNSLDPDHDRKLQADNWRIIAHARYQKGDRKGARQAQQKVDDISR